METKEIVPVQGSNSLSVSQDGHLYLDMTVTAEKFKNWIDKTPKEEVQKTITNVAAIAFLASLLILILADR